jgi:hypothetical protein
LEQISILISSVTWGCPNPNQHVYSANEIVWIHHPDLKPSLDSLKTPKKVVFVSCLAGQCRDPYSWKSIICIYIYCISCKKT